MWAAPGRTTATVRDFFDLLGPKRCAQITHVSADGADFIDAIVAATCPNAVRVADPFHVVKSASEALDEVRRAALKRARYSLWKNPENLSENQRTKLTWIAATDPRLYRAYLLKEGLRLIFTMPYAAAVEALERWISWACRCTIPSFVKLRRSIVNTRRGSLPRSSTTCPTG